MNRTTGIPPRFWPACLGVALLAAVPARAALNAYLTLKGRTQGEIRGSSTQRGRENRIVVIAFEHELKVPVDTPTGRQAGRRQHGHLTITKEIDRTTPLLYETMRTGEELTEFELQCWKPGVSAASGTAAEKQHYTIRLTGARVVGIKQQMPNTRDPDLRRYESFEEVSFSYETITWTWTDGGITATDTRQ
jgi:type VI secretion system secreted protein Hcp